MVSDDILVGLLALFSGVVGSSLQYVFSIKSKSRESQMKLKTEAYADFVNSVTGITFSQKNSDKIKELEYKIILTDAKFRIATFGSKEVIDSMAIFFGGRAILDNPESIESFIDIIQAMRRDCFHPDQSVPNDEIISLLFK